MNAIQLYNQAKIQAQKSNFSEAIRLFEMAIIENDIKFSEAYYELGKVYFEIGQGAKALYCFIVFYFTKTNSSVIISENFKIKLTKSKTVYDAKVSINLYRTDISQDLVGAVAYDFLGRGCLQLDVYKALYFNLIANDIANGRYPETEEALADTYLMLGNFPKAIIHFKNALKLSNEKLFFCYYGLGLIYEKNGDNKKAIENFKKFIDIGENNPISLGISALHKELEDSYIKISQLYISNGDFVKSKGYLLRGANKFPRSYNIFNFVCKIIEEDKSYSRYKNREYYLSLIFDTNVYEYFKRIKIISFNNYISETERTLELNFIYLLRSLSVSLPIDLNEIERLRLSYLLSFLYGYSWLVFDIIDQEIDGKYDLSPMDYSFYLDSALKIAEPFSELEDICNELEHFYNNDLPNQEDDLFSDFLRVNIDLFRQAINSKKMIDTYLLSNTVIDIRQANININNEINKTLGEAILSIMNSDILYDLPISANEIKGIHYGELTKLSYIDESNNQIEYINYFNSLNGFNESNCINIITNIRICISNSVNPAVLMKPLLSSYAKHEGDFKTQKRISLLQRCVILSALSESPKDQSLKNLDDILKNIFTDIAINKVMVLLGFGPGIICTMGSTLIGFLIVKGYDNIKQTISKKEKEILFNEIILELKAS